ncbi:hypothetical protein TNCV_1637431 [Trichonephila clavipes]|nr:hypothetical protein TNCV_1637431 [Trichonephila clavipes]
MGVHAPSHRTADVQKLLKREYITRTDLPTFAPDLNPIECVWDYLKRRLTSSKNTQQLKGMLNEGILTSRTVGQSGAEYRRCEATIRAVVPKLFPSWNP